MKWCKIIILLFACLTYRAQKKLNYTFDHLNQSTGFPTKSGSKIQKDKFGNLWMLTEKGIMKYNGHSGKIYGVKKDSSGLLPARTYNLYVDKDGLLWIGYLEAYMSCFNPQTEKFTHYYHDEKDKASFPNGGANMFFEDSKGNFWIAVWGGGLSKFDKKTGKYYTFVPDKNNPKSINTTEITDITELKDGRYLVSTWESGEYGKQAFLQYFDLKKNEFAAFPFDDYVFASDLEKTRLRGAFKIVHFTFEYGDNIWVGSFSGLICVNQKNKTITRYSGYVETKKEGWGNYENITSYVLNGNQLWLATEVAGIMVIDLNTKKCSYINHDFNISTSISSDVIQSLYKDEDENIWVSTGGGGIDIYSPIRQQFKLYTNDKLKAEKANRAQGQTAIADVCVSRFNDNIYLSHGNGFTILNRITDSVIYINTSEIFQKFKGNIYIEKINKPYVVNQIKEISENEIIVKIGVYSFIYNIKTKSANFRNSFHRSFGSGYDYNGISYFFRYRHYSKNKNTKYLLEKYSNGRVVDSINLPEFKYSTETWGRVSYVQHLDNNKWYVDFNRHIFYIFDANTKQFKGYSSRKGIENFPDSLITPLTVDSKGNIWLKSDAGGIYKFDFRTEKTVKYNDVFGLRDKEFVQSITEDKDGILWVALRQDLIRYTPTTDKKFRFTKKLGLNIGNFSPVQTTYLLEDEVFISVGYGLLKFNPQKLNFKSNQPELFMFNIIVNKDTLNESAQLEFINGTTLKWNKNFLTFEFASKQYYTPGNKIYTYRLLGLDTSWYNNEGRNYVSYTNLAPGDYTLEVSCKNVFGVVSKPFSLSFKIAPPFWKTWWFIVLEIIMAVGLIYFYVKYREKKLNKDKEKLELIVTERTKEIVEKAKEIELQKEIIEERNKEVTDSIKYALRIQKTLLAHDSLLEQNLPNYFTLFKPKDIVSGDFYWATNNANNLFYLAICDCTGHGVPGAFMSLLNISFLNEAIAEKNIIEPNLVLNYVREKLIVNLSFDGAQDGMDGTLISYNKANKTLKYASSNNRPILVRNGMVNELPADKMPIGKGERYDSFTLQTIEMQKNDVIYFYTDGFADQFGGTKGKKFKYKQLNELLISISTLPMEIQKERLLTIFEEWRGNLDQIDDVCLIGIKF